MLRRSLLASSLAAPLVARGLAAEAQGQWPAKTVRFIVPFAPGGGTDTVSRLICDQLGRTFGQQFVVDNKGGAGGNIGTAELARAAPDGYTIGLITVASHTLNPMLYSKLPYDADKDIVGISRVAVLSNLLGVPLSLPAGSVAELIALCKKEPGRYSFASSGPGTSLHLSGELFKTMAGVDIVHVPYKGAQPALTDLIAGHAQLMFATSASVIPYMKAGRLRALAVTTAQRSPSVPDLPTVAEAGLPGFEATTWHGVVVPAATSPALVQRLNQDINAALKEKDLSERLAGLGAEVVTGTPREFADYIAREIPRWSKVVRDSGARAD